MLSLPMTTVGVAIPVVPEEDVVAGVLETTDVGLRVGLDDVATIVEVEEDVKI